MTPQERDMLDSFAGRIANTPAPQKDAEADALIRDRIASKPDALYILTQTALIQEIALNQANQRLHDLQQQINNQAGATQTQHTSFLGRLFGSNDQQQYAPRPPAQYAQSQYAAPPQYVQQPQYAPMPGSGSSFLRSAAETATGVAAGALAFEGIESLFGHHGGGFGGGGSFLGNDSGETVINNYYEDGQRGNDGGGNERGNDRFADSNYDDSQSNVDNSTDADSADYSDAGSDDYSSGGDDSGNDSGNSSDV